MGSLSAQVGSWAPRGLMTVPSGLIRWMRPVRSRFPRSRCRCFHRSCVPQRGRALAWLVSPSCAGPFVDVVDVAELGGDVAAPVSAVHGQQLCCVAGFAGEQALGATEVDDDVVGVDDDAADAAADHGFQCFVGMNGDTGRCRTPPSGRINHNTAAVAEAQHSAAVGLVAVCRGRGVRGGPTRRGRWWSR